MKKVLAALFILLLIACGQPADANLPMGNLNDSVNLPTGTSFDTIHKYHDDADNVTCWVYIGYNKGGISCIPDDQLKGDK